MKIIDRRQFLQMGLATTAGVVAATAMPGLVYGRSATTRRGTAPGTGLATATVLPHDAAPLSERRLVILDCAGGNDGMSMLPPIGNSLYIALRPRTYVDETTLLPIAGSTTVGMHPALARIHGRNPAIIQGIGVTQPDLSHFEMLRRWWSGDQSSAGQTPTGFLGRLCDEIGDSSAAAVGLSLGYGPSPSLNSASAITMSMDPYSDGSFPTFDDIDMHRAWVAAWKIMAERPGNESVPFCSARDGAAYAKRFSAMARHFPAAGGTYPDTDLGYQLQLAARILAQDNGVRILHVPFYADFDTHDDHSARHAVILGDLDQAIDAFLDDLAARGLADKVLVAMTSEFGRRVPDNESNGLDHGASSFLFVFGPGGAEGLVGGLHGQYPDLSVLDANDNLISTVSMADYYASLAEDWFGVPASSVIPGGTPIAGLFS
jgi:uncharacterized protein (DUF1501 family)